MAFTSIYCKPVCLGNSNKWCRLQIFSSIVFLNIMSFSFYLEACGNVKVSWELYECVVAKLHDSINVKT